MREKKVAHSIENPRTYGFKREKNDCSVRAAAFATGETYKNAYELMEKLGRRKDRGMSTLSLSQLLDKGDLLGHKVTKVSGINYSFCRSLSEDNPQRGNEMTLAVFIRLHPIGRFYCLYRGHAVAVVDGVVKDTFQNLPGRRIFAAWQVEA